MTPPRPKSNPAKKRSRKILSLLARLADGVLAFAIVALDALEKRITSNGEHNCPPY